MAGFRYLCTGISDASVVRDQLTQLGELLAIVSFLKLSTDTLGLSLQSRRLYERAEALLIAADPASSGPHCDEFSAHIRVHLTSARRQLENALSTLRPGTLGRHDKVMTQLTGARSELERVSTLLGATIFDASTCCALHTNWERDNGEAFRLGA